MNCKISEINDTVTTYISSDSEGKHTLSFRPIALADMPFIWEYLRTAPGRTTDFSFGGVAMWVDYFNYQYCIVHDTLFIMGVLEDNRSIPAFSIPVGRLPLSKSLVLLKNYCRAHDMQLQFSAVPEEGMRELVSLGDPEIYEIRDWEDYLYDIDKLASLSGKKMAKKRNHVNRFKTLYEGRWKFMELTPVNVHLALEFMDVADAEGANSQSASDERMLSRRILEEWPLLQTYMQGALLLVDGQVCAITLGDMRGDTLYIHVEKASRAIEGSYEMINHLFANYMHTLHPHLCFVNREDDAGDEGLRAAKQSYHPIQLLKKYDIRF